MKRKVEYEDSTIIYERIECESLLEAGMMKLNSWESRIVFCSLRAIAYMSLSTILRAARCWVRDKIIDADIEKVETDIALHNLMRIHF